VDERTELSWRGSAAFFNSDSRSGLRTYGAIGTIIGQRDFTQLRDQGATFDANGRIQGMWTPEDLAQNFRGVAPG